MLAGHRDLRKQAILTAIRAKVRIVAEDPQDRTGRRALLNLGHSFAHAIESEAGLGRLLHGEAVAIGIALAFRLSAELGLCPPGDTARVIDHFASVGLSMALGFKGERLVDWMVRDKKNLGDRLSLVLVRGIGKAYVDRSVDRDRLANFLNLVG